jgi:hypothetical protein
MSVFLKIKAKSLAVEATIIRQEEAKYLDRRPGSVWWWLNYHRIVQLRQEARATHLAYSFLRGRAYRQVENKCHTQPDWQRVTQLVKKYGDAKLLATLDDWRKIGHNSALKTP